MPRTLSTTTAAHFGSRRRTASRSIWVTLRPAQIIVALRPETLAKHPEGKKLLAAAGPIGDRLQKYLNDVLLKPAGVEHLLIGCELKSDGTWHVTLVAHLTGDQTAEQHFDARLHGAEQKHIDGKTYWLYNGRAYYVPKSRDKKLLVVAPEDAISDIIDLAGSAPPLRRDIERLIAHTDANRDVTIIVAPNSLFSEGQSIFAGELSGLRRPLFWFLGDEFSGAALSVHWDKNFFLELDRHFHARYIARTRGANLGETRGRDTCKS